MKIKNNTTAAATRYGRFSMWAPKIWLNVKYTGNAN
ncbi:MAG: hypothetical protein ACI8PV_001097 [Dinoroseobacter sp.]